MPVATPKAWVARRFQAHYVEWRERRVAAVRAHYGDAFFAGRTLLELGCGYGDIGAAFAALGARVTCCDGRREHLEVLRERFPQVAAVHADLNVDWPFGAFDIVLHMGLLYHLEPTHASLRRACRSATHLVLESEVCDLDDDVVIEAEEQGYDQALDGRGCRPTAARVERILREEGFTFARLADARCNSGMHVYDWPARASGRTGDGQRRFWFARREQG